MEVPILIAQLSADPPIRGAASLLRGFFAHRRPESILLHQHCGDGESHRFAYLYPRVQYRMRHGAAELLGVAEGVTAVSDALQDLKSLELAGYQHQVTGIELREEMVDLAEVDSTREYGFVSPWLAPNQSNYLRFQSAGRQERGDLLRRLLIGNVLSMCKSLGIWVAGRLEADVDLRAGGLGQETETSRLCRPILDQLRPVSWYRIGPPGKHRLRGGCGQGPAGGRRGASQYRLR